MDEVPLHWHERTPANTVPGQVRLYVAVEVAHAVRHHQGDGNARRKEGTPWQVSTTGRAAAGSRKLTERLPPYRGLFLDRGGQRGNPFSGTQLKPIGTLPDLAPTSPETSREVCHPHREVVTSAAWGTG